MAYVVDQGRVWSHPDDIDSIMQKQWGEVFQGNGQVEDVAARFLAVYSEDIIRRPTFQVKPLEPARLQKAFRRAPAKAGGMDTWTPVELRCMPMAAAKALTEVLEAIELGAPGQGS